MRKLTILLALMIISVNAYSQSNLSIFERPAFGFYAGLNFNSHLADFKKIDGINDCCTQYKDGTGMGVAFGFLYSIPLSRLLNFEARLGYFNRNGLLKSNEEKVVNLNGDAAKGVFEHSIDAGLGSISIEPRLNLKIFHGLMLTGGFHAGFMVAKSADVVEKILEPSTGTFENNLRERLNYNGDIPGAQSIEMSALLGLSYNFGLDGAGKYFLAPEVAYYFGLTQVTDKLIANAGGPAVDWHVNTLNVGLAFRYVPGGNLLPGTKPDGTREDRIIAPPKKNQLEGRIKAYGVDADSVEREVLRFKVEEFLSTNIKPMLTYIFFDEGQSTLAPKYVKLSKSDANKFTEKSTVDMGILQTYYHVLNIIGRRMIENPTAKITIEGCNNNKGVEAGNESLSENRARSVFNYLKDTWGIDTARMIVAHRNLPQDPSNINEADGQQENRRVEITANKFEIIAPVIVDDTLRSVNPPVVRFYPEVKAEAGVKDWNLKALQNNSLINRFDGKGDPPKYVEWKFDHDQGTIPKQDADLVYNLGVTDVNGQKKETADQIMPIELITIQQKKRNRVADKYIDRYSLILFGFDYAKLSFYNKKMTDLIRSKIAPDSKIFITGHTDRLGDDAYNLKLSRERAASVGTQFNKDQIIVNGYGEVDPIYDNELPEGRFFSRKVDVVVETPVK